MSDSEDELTVHEDIKALKAALSQSTQISYTSNDEPSTSRLNDDLHLTVYHSSYENIPEQYESSNVNETPNTNKKLKQIQKLLDINEELTKALSEAKEKFLALLKQCNSRKEMVEQKLGLKMKLTTTKHYNWSIAMPYFKTKDGYYAPLNNDAKLKAARHELEIYHLPVSCRWTMRDKSILLQAIRDEINSKIQLNSNENLGKNVLSLEAKKYIGAVGEKEFDWMKIGTAGFQNRHTSEECRVMWNVFLHPEINKTKWSKKEDILLNVLVKNHNYQDWDKIAEKLETKRSGYQCFIRYNTNNVKHMVKSVTWTKEEDEKLKKIVELLRLGNFVPWGEVATYIPERTKQQIYYRWMYNVAPYLKKGRFTADEDEVFRSALAKYGPNFSRISTFVMPQRTSAQLNDHYNTLHTRETSEKLGPQGRSWDYVDDIKLLDLYDIYGTNWSRIAKEFENKTRIQVRHRYTSIKRYANRGISVESIPRTSNEVEENMDEILNLQMNTDDVDKELIEYFRELRNVGNNSNFPGPKYYSTNELADKVRRLYNVLQCLYVNIGHSDSVEHNNLSERDRQLFHVLEEYFRRSPHSIERQQRVEKYRVGMFGSSDPPKEHYIPPLPFGMLTKPRKIVQRKKNSNNSIDYVAPATNETQIMMDFDFLKTPSCVLEGINNFEDDEQLEKFKSLLETKTQEKNEKIKSKNSTKIYILSPEALNQYILKTRKSQGVVLFNKMDKKWEPIEVEELTEPLNYSWDWLTGSKGIEDDTNLLSPLYLTNRKFATEVTNFIKPTYSLLTCYQAILNYLKAYDKEEHTIERFKVSQKGRTALELLKNRFEILFTYPMCMATVSIPPGVKSNCTSLFWDVAQKRKRTKKRKLQEKSDHSSDDDDDENDIDDEDDYENEDGVNYDVNKMIKQEDIKDVPTFKK